MRPADSRQTDAAPASGSAAVYLGLETGGTKLVATVGTPEGRVLASVSRPRPPGNRAPDTLRQLVALGTEVVAQAGAAGRIAALGFGFGGIVDRTSGRPTLNLHEEGWADVDAPTVLGAAFGVPVFCENDCKVAALAEACLGNGAAAGVSVYLTIGSGIGGGIVLDGRILRCSPWGEAEVGHLVVDSSSDAPRCPCGNRGCLEALCSGWGVAERARHHAARVPPSATLAERLAHASDAEVARIVFEAYPNDALAKTCVDEFVGLVGRACSYVGNLLSPRAIVLGGGVIRSSWLVPRIEAEARRHLAPYLRQPIRFSPARLGESVVTLGAILHAHQLHHELLARNLSSRRG